MKKCFNLFAIFSLFASAAHAQSHPETLAKPWQLGFTEPSSEVMERLVSLHDNFLLWMCILISLFVLAALLYICVRYNRRANPVASKTSHNTKLEIIWTTIPILILVAIAIPSLRLHYFMEKDIEPGLTVKITANQWFWHYEYPDHGGLGFDSNILEDKDLKPGDHRLLAVDNRLVVPVDTKVRVLLTSADVIHALALPAFGVKRDAVPGRLNETWFESKKTGTFYGQCSVLCGVKHAFMPIVVDVVSKEEFNAWIEGKKKAAGIAPSPDKIAVAETNKSKE